MTIQGPLRTDPKDPSRVIRTKLRFTLPGSIRSFGNDEIDQNEFKL